MDKKKFILGAALMVGLDKQKFMKHWRDPVGDIRPTDEAAGHDHTGRT